MPGTEAPPAVELPNTRQMVGMRSAERRVSSRKVRPPRTKIFAWFGRSAPADSVRLMSGRRFCAAISMARKFLSSVIGFVAPPFTVGSLAISTHSTPLTTPTPVTTLAPMVNSVPHAASGESSRKGASRSRSSSMRSRGSSFFRSRWRRTYFSPPPARASASCSSSRWTCSSIAAWFTRYASERGSTRVGRTGIRAGGSYLKDLGHHLLHHLVRAPADAHQARVHEGARRGVLPAVARAAEELHARGRHVLLHPGGEDLRHRDVERRVLAAHHLADAAVRELLRRGDLDHHVDELVLVHLHLGERLPEGDALLAVAQGDLPEVPRRDRPHHHRHHALVLELIHLLLEAAVRVADRVRDRDADVVEEEEPGVRAEVADLVEELVAEAARVGRDDDLGEAAVARRRVGDREEAEPVGGGGVRDVHLGAVQDPVVAVAHGAGLDAGHVGAGARLGHGDRRHLLAADGRDEIALLQLLAAEAVERRGGHVGLHRDAHRDAGVVAARELLQEDRVVRVVEAEAAVALVVADAEEPELAHLAVEGLVDAAELVELAGPGDQLRLHEPADRVAERLVLCAAVDVVARVGHGRLRPPPAYNIAPADAIVRGRSARKRRRGVPRRPVDFGRARSTIR